MGGAGATFPSAAAVQRVAWLGRPTSSYVPTACLLLISTPPLPCCLAPPGAGQPLKQEDHGAQFHSVDPLVQAALRTMGAQSVKPRSLELQQEVQRELAALRRGLAAELRRALGVAREGQREQQQEPSNSGGGGDGGSGAAAGASSATASTGGWLGGWFGAGAGEQRQRKKEVASSSSRSRPPSVAGIRAGHHPALRHAAEEAGRLVQQYNSAVLADKETFGGSWPLHQMRQLDWGAEVDAALAAVGGAAMGGDAGKSGQSNGSSSGGGGNAGQSASL